MRVLMLCKDCVAGGTTRHAVDLSIELAARGIDVELVTPVGGRAFETTEVPGCRVLPTRSLGRSMSTELSPGAFRHAWSRPADVVHLHHPNPIGVAALTLHPRRPLVITYHGDMTKQFGLPGALYRAALRRLMHRADRLILTSEVYRERPEIRASRPHAEVIPLGVRPERLRVDAAALDAAAARRADWGERVVLFVGRLCYYKGLDVLLRAAVRTRARVVLAGEGDERPRLERITRELGLEDRVRFTGHLEGADLVGAYLASDVVVLPSTGIGESFGQTQVEAALLGKPVVSTNLPTGVPWVNLHGVSGLIVPPGDHVALAEALESLLDDPVRAQALGRAGKQRAEREFTADVMAERTIAVYESIVAAPAPARARSSREQASR